MGGRPPDALRLRDAALAVPLRLLPGRGGPARLARLEPDADARPRPQLTDLAARGPVRPRTRPGPTATTPASTRSRGCARHAPARTTPRAAAADPHARHASRLRAQAGCARRLAAPQRLDVWPQRERSLLTTAHAPIPPPRRASRTRRAALRTSTASFRGSSSTRGCCSRRRTSATRCWNGCASWPSSRATSTSSSRSGSPGSSSRSRQGTRAPRRTAWRRPRSSSASATGCSSSRHPTPDVRCDP